jgi:hypothetical protein
MKNGTMVTAGVLGMLLGAFAIGFSDPSSAQTALGGAAKTKQSTVGGAAKPGPVVGGATTPGSVGGAPKQNSTGGAKQTAKPNPPPAPPNKGGPVVTSNLKCAAGACAAKGTKP